MKNTNLLDSRRDFSESKMHELASQLNNLTKLHELPGLCVYATGSFARGEASEHSDIDLFFLHRGTEDESPVTRLDELALFAEIIQIGEGLGFPTFSNDGEFLHVLYVGDMLRLLGGREDDFHNYFTARMLLLLESKPLANQDLFGQIMEEVVEAYFRDYPDHSKDFKPLFLINDILRFWKTLCLNYEHRRNRPEDDRAAKIKQQVKNFKLKFSRLMTCFGTIVAICAKEYPIERKEILSLTKMPPLQRFISAVEGEARLEDIIHEVLRDYQWFMELTGLTKEELHTKFESHASKVEFFSRGDQFGDRVYKILDFFARQNDYRRYLVV